MGHSRPLSVLNYDKGLICEISNPMVANTFVKYSRNELPEK